MANNFFTVRKNLSKSIDAFETNLTDHTVFSNPLRPKVERPARKLLVDINRRKLTFGFDENNIDKRAQR